MEDHLKEISHGECHKGHCPHCYDEVPNITGSHELDTIISISKNKDMLGRLNLYIVGDIYNSAKMDR
jgi:hypothetical protein